MSDVSFQSALDAHLVARRLAALPDRLMRAATLGDLVLATTPEDAVWLLDALATAGRAGGPPFDVSLLAAVDLAASDRLPYEHRRLLFETAERLGLDACKELLFSDEQPGNDEAAAPRALTPGTRPLTLGERKALARSWRRDTLERLLVDPHVDVVTRLLVNPHLTEGDVLKIATARRSSPAVLKLILQSRRWAVRPAVRRALVRNPRLPEAAALRLIGLLNLTEIREIAGDPGMSPRMKAALQRRLRAPS